MGKPLLAYIDWAIAENNKPCSAYYQSLDTTKIATNGFSCGGLMAEGTAGDPRITTWGLNSSGLFAADQALYKTVHTPVLIVLGGSDDIAYENGENDYDAISALGIRSCCSASPDRTTEAICSMARVTSPRSTWHG